MISKQLKLFYKSKQGSIVLESALVIPLFLSLIFVIILISIAAVQFNTKLFVQLTAAERASFIWDEYDRELSSGIRQSKHRYGVYENDLMLNMLSNLFALNDNSSTYSYSLRKNTSPQHTKNKLWQDKLTLTNAYLINGQLNFDGHLYYERKIIPRVVIKLEDDSLFSAQKISTYTSSVITDATQHIRGVDLLLYYTEKIKNISGDKKQWLAKGRLALPSS